MKAKVTDSAQQLRGKYSSRQKAFIVYCLILLFLLLVLPLIKLDYLNSTNIDSFTIFNKYMTKTWVLVVAVILFLLAWNTSFRFKKMLHRGFGFAPNDMIINALLLFILLLTLFSIGDTVGLLKQNFSYRISSTNGFMIIGIWLILGVAWSIISARLQWKREAKTQSVTIKSEVDDSKLERGFDQARKEFEGLFGEEESQ